MSKKRTGPKERGIAFKPEMVRAILAGEKWQTRRLVSMPDDFDGLRMASGGGEPGGSAIAYRIEPGGGEVDCTVVRPLVRAGDTLWVREAWRVPHDLDPLSGSQIAESALDAGYSRPWAPTQYEADGARTGEWAQWCARAIGPGRYRHARFMPRWASRIARRVLDVRIERLGDINTADAIAEGAVHWAQASTPEWTATHRQAPSNPKQCLKWLWDHVHGDGAWERDRERWTWVYEWANPGSLRPFMVSP